MMKSIKDIWTLSANYLSGEMNEKQKTKFLQNLEEDPQAKKEFQNIKISWDNFSGANSVHSEKAWERLRSRLEEEDLIPSPPVRKLPAYSFFARVAAIFIFTALISFSTYYILSPNQKKINKYESFTASGNLSSLNLPEGSRVFLNQKSQIRYPSDFTTHREIILEGEGFFEVTADPNNPFTVKTGSAKITVLGTRFNVKENKENKTTEVYVESGKVKLNSSENSNGIVLLKGEFAESDGKSEWNSIKTDKNYLAWKTLEFRFENEELGKVLEVLGNSYHVNIKAENPEIETFRITSRYNRQSIDAILNTVCIAFDLEYELKKDTYFLRMK